MCSFNTLACCRCKCTMCVCSFNTLVCCRCKGMTIDFQQIHTPTCIVTDFKLEVKWYISSVQDAIYVPLTPTPHIVMSVNLYLPAFPHAVPQASNCHVSEPTFPNTHLSPTLCVQFHEVSLAPGGRAWRCAAELGHRWHLCGREMCRHVSWPGQLQLWHLSVW